ncbi:MAG: glycosyltransferase family 2 protein, partial [Thermodesulfobacteriota bacterium]
MPDEESPFITVIIPVHNSAEFINDTLDALTESSYKQFEIIVVDDASKDESIDICKRKGIAAIQLPNKSGPAAARNVG